VQFCEALHCYLNESVLANESHPIHFKYSISQSEHFELTPKTARA
jgi:hypothetical protein